MDIVIEAMKEFYFETDGAVITEGDDGDYLYVVETGSQRCTKLFPGATEPTKFKDYQPGEAFGELALLYNAPRAASITANEPSTLWGLDRQTFNHIVKDAAMRKREMYEEFLKKVPLLSNMDSYE
jgi:cAMP-dependent protein kinase regulator